MENILLNNSIEWTFLKMVKSGELQGFSRKKKKESTVIHSAAKGKLICSFSKSAPTQYKHSLGFLIFDIIIITTSRHTAGMTQMNE